MLLCLPVMFFDTKLMQFAIGNFQFGKRVCLDMKHYRTHVESMNLSLNSVEHDARLGGQKCFGGVKSQSPRQNSQTPQALLR